MFSIPQTLIVQMVTLILLASGWFQSWSRLVRPSLRMYICWFFGLQLVASFFTVNLSPGIGANLGGLLAPALFALFFSHDVRGFLYPASAILLNTVTLLFVREFIRYSPVFWIMDEAWGVAMLAVLLSFATGRQPAERWLFLTGSLLLSEMAFLSLHAGQLGVFIVADGWFQRLWWCAFWVGTTGSALFHYLLHVNLRFNRKYSFPALALLRKATLRKPL
ncbi:MAG: hypothetical protein BAA01_02860 [Bacillus thermozeamaize]|uniref:Uncharacterized protein n=1 Tax=Bacillus thermozeamaize TaxID=230954 RepID=A0A1Y3PWY3_9BACI|nr:MAG: hypothetical protein BAA01_02860 [Bacillus thermozeamaize]